MTTWEDLWAAPAAPEPHAAPTGVPGPVSDRYAARALEAETTAVLTAAPGRRNHQLNESTFNLAQLVPSGALTEDTIRATLTPAARGAGLPDNEIRATITSGIAGGIQHPRIVPERDDVPAVTFLNGTAGNGADTAAVSEAIRSRIPIIDWHELWTQEDDEEWIVEPILPARRLVALFSAPKIGKSLLMLEVAVGVARGTPVLGVTPDRPRRVLYVDFENDPRGDIRTRLQAMGLQPGDLDNLCYLSYPRLAKLDTIAGGLELMAVVEEYGCEVVIIDTISRAVQGEENENDTWLSFYRNTGMALKAAGISCVRLDHTGKDHDKGMRGGSAKYGDVDAVWKLSAVTDETYRLDCTDHRMQIHEKCIVVKRALTPHLEHRVQAEGRLAAFEAQVIAVTEVLDQADVAADTGRTKAREVIRGTGVRASNSVLDEAIRRRKMRLGITDMGAI